MAGRLDGRIAVITGAGSGIGRATALRFVADGADVLAVDRNGEGAAETVRQAGNGPGRCVAAESDVTAEDSPGLMFARCRAELGPADVLVNNAGIGGARPVHDTTDEALDRFLDVNLKALMRYAREALVDMRARRAGVIVNIASVFGIRGFPGSSTYSATKAAVIGLTQNMAADYGPDGIRVNAIAPGIILTPLTETRLATNAWFKDGMLGQTPLGRLGRPEDIAAAIAFLVSDDASFISGHTLVVDGGWATTKFRPLPDGDYA